MAFYFAGNAKRVREFVRYKGNVELGAGDPAPDSVLKVDITGSSLDKARSTPAWA